MFKNIHAKSINLDLRIVILLYIQSNMDILCNPKFFGKIYKAKKKMRLHSNGGKILISHKAQVAVYKPHVWFDQKDITNIISLNNLVKDYYFVFNRLDDMFILHLEEHGKHNMHFIMHKISIHYYDPEDE